MLAGKSIHACRGKPPHAPGETYPNRPQRPKGMFVVTVGKQKVPEKLRDNCPVTKTEKCFLMSYAMPHVIAKENMYTILFILAILMNHQNLQSSSLLCALVPMLFAHKLCVQHMCVSFHKQTLLIRSRQDICFRSCLIDLSSFWEASDNYWDNALMRALPG